MAEQRRQLNTPASGLRAKMDYWEQRDVKTEFNILVSQALNLAVELVNGSPALAEVDGIEGAIRGEAKDFFKLLLELRSDTDLRARFRAYHAKAPVKQEHKTSGNMPGRFYCKGCGGWCDGECDNCERCNTTPREPDESRRAKENNDPNRY